MKKLMRMKLIPIDKICKYSQTIYLAWIIQTTDQQHFSSMIAARVILKMKEIQKVKNFVKIYIHKFTNKIFIK